ncbi:MAG: D-cysteine desulfhydrase family protein [candidate division KSB1 bacterium]|nr:D-cysteine desulfhydrase family protein [candidate division KSB1 bacterium]MDZ7318193.1 D-cysteine desulfhydrase family protein [candidate division KSB1 bacterium]MDZ7340578.1 D-cysteine desulfhydrase family protein [candidate division KSB1 bacterium]
MAFPYPARLSLAHLPTPIERMPQLSQQWHGPEIYIKRDDLTGFELSGNKIRKLEFVIAEAQRQGANYLITCGGVQSNHARATAIAAARLGLSSYLVLRGSKDEELDGNLLLDYLVGAQIKFISADDYANRVEDIMAELAEDLRRQGHRPYIIPEGASNELGAIGYLSATEEIAAQCRQLKVTFDYVVCAVGSGGTHAGLLLGQKLYHQPYQVIGFNVCDDEAYFVQKISGIMRRAIGQFNLNINFHDSDITIIDGYVGAGYALNRQEEINFIREIARTTGIILDPVYTAKAFYGLKDQIIRGRFQQDDRILFIHTGGGFGLFPKRKLFLL